MRLNIQQIEKVHISISRTMNEFEIAVQDFGEGITEEDLEKIFVDSIE